MKKYLIVFTLSTILAVPHAQAGCGSEPLETCEDYGYLGCAPEVVEGNLKATDRILVNLAAQPAFAGADKFRAALAQLRGVDSASKIKAYKDYLGITNTAEYVAFLKARTNGDRRVFIQNTMSNLDLSENQGEILVEELSKALVGELL